MSWVTDNLENALNTWNSKLAEIWQLITQSPEEFKGGAIWDVIVNIHSAVKAIGLGFIGAVFVVGVVKTCGSIAQFIIPYRSITEVKRSYRTLYRKAHL